LEDCVKILGLLGLDGAYDYVFPALVPPPGLVKHAIGLANACCVPKKNLKSRTPPLVLFRLRLQKEPFGTGPREFGDTHHVDLPATV
jgi:hypothetical protein